MSLSGWIALVCELTPTLSREGCQVEKNGDSTEYKSGKHKRICKELTAKEHLLCEEIEEGEDSTVKEKRKEGGAVFLASFRNQLYYVGNEAKENSAAEYVEYAYKRITLCQSRNTLYRSTGVKRYLYLRGRKDYEKKGEEIKK